MTLVAAAEGDDFRHISHARHVFLPFMMHFLLRRCTLSRAFSSHTEAGFWLPRMSAAYIAHD